MYVGEGLEDFGKVFLDIILRCRFFHEELRIRGRKRKKQQKARIERLGCEIDYVLKDKKR